MNRDVSVSLLVSVVLLDKVQVVTADDDGTLHLHLDNLASQDSASDANVAGEGTFFVDVVAFDCLSWSFES